MLKLAGVLAGLALLGGYAQAEQPERVIPETGISIGIGRSETLRFKSAFSNIAIAAQGVVLASAQSDHVLTLTGQAEGETILTVSNGDGRELYSTTVRVTQEPGHIVRIYGKGGVPDYVGFYCTDAACGRADKELGGARDLSSKTTTVLPGGGFSRTQTFGR